MNVIEGNTKTNAVNSSIDVSQAQQSRESAGAIANAAINNPKAIESSAVIGEHAKAVNQEVLSPQQLEKVAQQLQEFVGEMNRGLEFSVDTDSGRDVIKVIDKSSGDLVKQYPSEEVLSLVAKLSDMVGGLVDLKI
ncbi:MAG: flagellar protein FlaG [Sinobacterium sp.]